MRFTDYGATLTRCLPHACRTYRAILTQLFYYKIYRFITRTLDDYYRSALRPYISVILTAVYAG